MKLKKRSTVIALSVIAGLTMAVFLVSADGSREARQSAASNASPRTIVGVWRTVVTPRNCATGE